MLNYCSKCGSYHVDMMCDDEIAAARCGTCGTTGPESDEVAQAMQGWNAAHPRIHRQVTDRQIALAKAALIFGLLACAIWLGARWRGI